MPVDTASVSLRIAYPRPRPEADRAMWSDKPNGDRDVDNTPNIAEELIRSGNDLNLQ